MKNKLFLLIVCALLSYTPIYSTDTKAQEQELQENLVRLASNGKPYDDATLTEVASNVKQIAVGFELDNNATPHDEAVWKDFVANVIDFYSKVMKAESKEAVFDAMMLCLNELGSKESHGRINVLLGTNQQPQEDPLDSLEAQN